MPNFADMVAVFTDFVTANQLLVAVSAVLVSVVAGASKLIRGSR